MELARECSVCKVMVNFAKGDAATGNIPKIVYCPKCQPKKGWVNESTTKSDIIFAGEPVIGKTTERGKWERKAKE